MVHMKKIEQLFGLSCPYCYKNKSHLKTMADYLTPERLVRREVSSLPTCEFCVIAKKMSCFGCIEILDGSGITMDPNYLSRDCKKTIEACLQKVVHVYDHQGLTFKYDRHFKVIVVEFLATISFFEDQPHIFEDTVINDFDRQLARLKLTSHGKPVTIKIDHDGHRCGFVFENIPIDQTQYNNDSFDE